MDKVNNEQRIGGRQHTENFMKKKFPHKNIIIRLKRKSDMDPNIRKKGFMELSQELWIKIKHSELYKLKTKYTLK